MAEFKLEPRFISVVRRRSLLLSVPLVIVASGLGFYFAGRDLLGSMRWFMWGAVVIILLIAAAIGLFFGIRRSLRFWDTYRIVVDEDGVTQVRQGRNLRILYGEITRINLGPGGLTIRTSDPFRFIEAPRLLERFDDFRLELARRHAVDEVPPRQGARNGAIQIGALVLMLAVVIEFFIATNRYVIIAASIGVLLMAVYMVFARRKGLTPASGGFLYWFGVIFLAALAIGRALLAILGD